MTDRTQAVASLKYAKPKLVVYGGMATLTAAGSTNEAENAMIAGPTAMP